MFMSCCPSCYQCLTAKAPEDGTAGFCAKKENHRAGKIQVPEKGGKNEYAGPPKQGSSTLPSYRPGLYLVCLTPSRSNWSWSHLRPPTFPLFASV